MGQASLQLLLKVLPVLRCGSSVLCCYAIQHGKAVHNLIQDYRFPFEGFLQQCQADSLAHLHSSSAIHVAQDTKRVARHQDSFQKT
jgi:hypothetical protein